MSDPVQMALPRMRITAVKSADPNPGGCSSTSATQSDGCGQRRLRAASRRLRAVVLVVGVFVAVELILIVEVFAPLREFI